MKNTKNELKQAILLMAKHFGQEPNFKALFSENSLPRMVEMIVYQMFMHSFDPNSSRTSDELYDAYKLIKEYADELKVNGSVSFTES